jgi:hypothetical protein
MELIHAGLLFLLPLAAVPVVLHLLSMHRLKTVELSTFRFLFDSFVQQRRKMRFLEALVAILRVLFLLIVVLAVARPVASHWNALFHGGGGRDVLLLVDCSASMNAQTDGVSSFDRAKAAVRKIIERLHHDDRLTLCRVAAQTEDVFSRFSADAGSVVDYVDSLKTGPSRANFFAALNHVFGQEKNYRVRPLVYVVTDCQASNWREFNQPAASGKKEDGKDNVATQAALSKSLVPAGAELVVVNVASQHEVANVGVIGNPPPRERAVVGLPLRLSARVANFSKTKPADVTLSLFIDDKEVARTPLALKPGQKVEHVFPYVPTETGVLRGRFEITHDRFPDDDRYQFIISPSPQIKVLLVNGNQSPDPFQNESLYLRTALTATASREGPRGAAKTAAANSPALKAMSAAREMQRQIQVVEINEWNVSPASLADANAVILANCGQLNQQHFTWLRDYVRDGGGLLIFPGDRVNADAYNNQFFKISWESKQKFMGVKMGYPRGDVQKYDSFRRLELVDYTHPALRVFDDPKARYFATANFYRSFPLKLDEASETTWSLAGFSDREPALVECRFGDGLAMLAAFPATSQWSNLPLKPEFVPLILQMVNRVERRAELDGPGVVPPDGLAEITVAASWNPVTATVTDPAGHASELTFQQVGKRMVGGCERTSTAGYYRVEVNGGKPDQPKHGETAFAVDVAPEESQLAAADMEDIRRLLPSVSLRLVDASAEAQQQFGSVGEGTEIWRLLLTITFLVIGAEFWLSTYGGRPVQGGDNAGGGSWLKRLRPGLMAERWIGSHGFSEERGAKNKE